MTDNYGGARALPEGHQSGETRAATAREISSERLPPPHICRFQAPVCATSERMGSTGIEPVL